MYRDKENVSGHGKRKNIALALGIIFFLLSTLAVHGEGQEENTSVKADAAPDCLSGMRWTGGNKESPEMHPGMSCINCHSKGEGPSYVIAGTVYQRLNEADDCYGVEGAEVQITDASGKVIKLETNKAGNFFLRTRGESVTMPIEAKVVYQGKENQMMTPQSTGNCLLCHTSDGASGAPGRIIIPST